MSTIVETRSVSALAPANANNLSPTSLEPRPLELLRRHPSVEQIPRPWARRLAPGLEVRLQRLEDQRQRQEEAARTWRDRIGRIPEEQLQSLERLHQQQTEQQPIEVLRRGRARTGPPVRVMPSSGGGVRLDGLGPAFSETEASMLESDVSSIISVSDRLEPSDTEEDGDGTQEKQKYRMPDIGKTRLHLRTKEPLSPTPRQVPRSPRRQTSISTPGTPRTMQSPSMINGEWQQSPYQEGFAGVNGSNESINDSDFVYSGLSRANSIYTLGRASLQGQLAALTSLRLPDADSLAKKISDILTSTEAAKALSDASDQIRIWISKASDVLTSLSADDDVEWAAAGGREGISDVDEAIHRFQRLIDVYLLSIEGLQTRSDVSSLPTEDLDSSVKQMENILTSWHRVKQTLSSIKRQVEIAMEWEELWNSVLGEIGQEMEGLNRLVFEMEEQRHQHGAETLLFSSKRDSIDLHELEVIVEERPGQGASLSNHSHRLSLPPFSPTSPTFQQTPAAQNENGREDSSLLALFARMQPLRASLDFLPMRLSVFHSRGNATFPSACQDLEERRDQLELQWRKLEADAESLRRELGEDRWILVFRNAGRQALKMEESITRSFGKLKEALELSENQTSEASFGKKVESYEAKKLHYGPAIERVLAIIDRGVQDRLTVNGEILRLQEDMKSRWSALQAEMREMDIVLHNLLVQAGMDGEAETSREKQLRDSVSTVMSSEQRSVASSALDLEARSGTPGSSPPSSVVGGASGSMTSSFHDQGSRTPTPMLLRDSAKVTSGSSIPTRRRALPKLAHSGGHVSSPASSPSSMRARVMSNSKTSLAGGRPVSVVGRKEMLALPPVPDNRPRWIGSRKVENRDFLPLSALEPSPYAKAPLQKQTNFLRSTSTSTPGLFSKTNMRNVSTPSRLSQSRPAPSTVPRVSVSVSISQQQQPQTPALRKSSLPVPSSAPSRTTSAMASSRRAASSTTKAGHLQTSATDRRSSVLGLPPPPPTTDGDEVDGNEADGESPSHHKSRPSSALSSAAGKGRRGSLLSGRSRGGSNANDAGAPQQAERPRWR